VLSAVWEVRHGAAIGLRAIIRNHGADLGAPLAAKVSVREAQNRLFSEDLSLRICCVIALDRFGDYASASVVAPVRDTCCQVLGLLARNMDPMAVGHLVNTLARMQSRDQWHVRHASFLARKYVIAARNDMISVLGEKLLSAVIVGLQDGDDEVVGVAADALASVCNELYLVEKNRAALFSAADICWDILASVDEVSSTTTAVMRLLSELHGDSTKVSSYSGQSAVNIEELIPRLWPLFTFRAADVRIAAMQTLERIIVHTLGDETAGACTITGVDLIFEVMFKSMLTELDERAINLGLRVWTTCCRVFASADLVASVAPRLQAWAILLGTPAGRSFDETYFTRAFSSSGQLRDMGVKPAMPQDVDAASRLRLHCCQALGQLIQSLPLDAAQSSLVSISGMLASSWAFERQCVCLIFVFISRDSVADVLSSEIAQVVQTSCVSALPMEPWKDLDTMQDALRADCRALQCGLEEVATALGQLDESFCSRADRRNNSQSISEAALELCTTEFDVWYNLINGSNDQLKEDSVQRLFALREQCAAKIGFLGVARARIEVSIKVSGAVALVSNDKVPKTLNPIIKALVAGIKKESASHLQKIAAEGLVKMMSWCHAHSKPKIVSQLLKNICAFICELEDSATALELSGTDIDSDDTDADIIIGRRIADRGARYLLVHLCQFLGASMLDEAPSLWSLAGEVLQDVPGSQPLAQEACENMKAAILVLQTIFPALHSDLRPRFLELLPGLFSCLQCENSRLVHTSCSCLATLAVTDPCKVIPPVVTTLLPILGSSANHFCRIGVARALLSMALTMELSILPYIILFIIPVMGSMSDQHAEVRRVGALCFARLIKLLPLEAGLPMPDNMPESMIQSREHERAFVGQLVGGTPPATYHLPMRIGIELRPYQQDGINWLVFLKNFKLHGVLCDEMGLGKTLQALCVVAADHYHRGKQSMAQTDRLPSLVICPATLVGHWYDEANRYCADDLSPLRYTGSPSVRAALRKKFADYSLIIASYDSVRTDIETLHPLSFNYCILDEGHAIRNSKAKVTQAVKRLASNYRLILSGTPVQNSVLELWSMFDFLMPGFLGLEAAFARQYSKPILESRTRKNNTAVEGGIMAMESLHRQVLPFILGRKKETVLKDLPPKILQDLMCDMSPLQVRLYDGFEQSQAAGMSLSSTVSVAESKHTKSNGALESMQYLRKVCNHPALVLSESHTEYKTIVSDLNRSGLPLRNLCHSPKMLALQQLLFDCGIGQGADAVDTPESGGVGQHRALVFFQLQSFLEIVERDLLSKMPSVSYMRVDGTVPPNERHEIVKRFNADPTIDVLLLTTKVGGLGLNLTGADTVIFMEHDWNPSVDLQAMDRAHRLGQNKVVNVYRLVSRGTIEEKIMGLQKFKISVARTVVSAENACMDTMNTGGIIDLLKYDPPVANTGGKRVSSPAVAASDIGNSLSDLQELWSESQYIEEFDLKRFVSTLE
jgi:TATA-binding protein-associated factor